MQKLGNNLDVDVCIFLALVLIPTGVIISIALVMWIPTPKLTPSALR